VTVLYGYRTLISELLKVRFEGQVVVEGLDIGRQNLAALGDVNGGVTLCAELSAHVSSMRTMSGKNYWRISSGFGGASRGGGVTKVGVDGGVNSGCRGALKGMQCLPARVQVQAQVQAPRAVRSGDGCWPL
jgi:hypothetical protein